MSDIPGTARPRSEKQSERRNSANAQAVRLLAKVRSQLVDEGKKEFTDRAIAKRLGYGSHHIASEMFDADEGAPVLLGDPEACGRALAERFHLAALAELLDDGAPLPATGEALAHLAVQIGRANQGLIDDLHDDGTVNNHAQHEAAFLRIAQQAMRGYLGARRARGVR